MKTEKGFATAPVEKAIDWLTHLTKKQGKGKSSLCVMLLFASRINTRHCNYDTCIPFQPKPLPCIAHANRVAVSPSHTYP